MASFSDEAKEFVREMFPHYTNKQVSVCGVDLDSAAYIDMYSERGWYGAKMARMDNEIRSLLLHIGRFGFSVLD